MEMGCCGQRGRGRAREFELEEKNYERSVSLWGPIIVVTNPQVTNK